MMRMAFALSLLLLGNVTRADVGRDIRRLGLSGYEQAGLSVNSFLVKNFGRLMDETDEENLAEALEQSYREQLEPGAIEVASAATFDRSTTELLRDVQNAVELRRWYAVDFRGRSLTRVRIQSLFVGLAHVLEVRLHQDLAGDTEGLARLHRHLMTQGTFISKGGSSLNLDDLWWDWIWLRSHDFPSDLVEMHLKKLEVISRGVPIVWQVRLRKYAVSQILNTLRHHAEPILDNEKPAVVSLRLVNAGLALLPAGEKPEIEKSLKLSQYKYLQATGQTYEASQIKKDIAKDLFFAKGKQLMWAPAEPWSRTDIGFFGKIFRSLAELGHSLLSFITYGAGFLFVATPIELFLVLGAAFILARQARTHFGVETRGLKARWLEHRIVSRDGWRRVPALTFDALDFLKHELHLAWRMFVASYTSVQVPFYSKVAASLLLFGVGLYFNSARSLVETVVAQMTM